MVLIPSPLLIAFDQKFSMMMKMMRMKTRLMRMRQTKHNEPDEVLQRFECRYFGKSSPIAACLYFDQVV